MPDQKPGQGDQHQNDQRKSDPDKVPERVACRAHDQQVGLVGHGRRVAEIRAKEYCQHERLSRKSQLVRHGHVLVNGKVTDIPSYSVDNGDIITVHEKSREVSQVVQAMGAVERRGIPAWLELDRATFTGKVKAIPTREELAMPLQEQLVVEFYSR